LPEKEKDYQHMQQQQHMHMKRTTACVPLVNPEKCWKFCLTEYFSALISNDFNFFILIIYILPTTLSESGFGTGFPILTVASALKVGCQRVIEPVSHLFFINLRST
jgi:hypothetical protein